MRTGKRISKAKVNLIIDAIIGIAFLVEAVSGFVLAIVLPHGGYQGGRNGIYGQTFVISRDAWLSLHDWFAIIMTLGVLVHLVLHWRWIVCMVRKLWREAFPRLEPALGEECPA